MNKIEELCAKYKSLKGARGNWETHVTED